MWSQVQKILHNGTAKGAMPPSVPLRKNGPIVQDLAVGKQVRFSKKCPLAPLTGASASIVSARQYHFGDDKIISYQLQIGQATNYYLTVAEDDQGHYLSLTRALNELEQDVWFGRDALSFFTEPSSAKSIRCKADLLLEGEWAGARYSKSVDWMEGTVAPLDSPRLARTLHYSLLVNEPGDKALEIEHDDANGDNRILVTVYRPIEDIIAIETVIEAIAHKEEKPVTENGIEVPLFREPALSSDVPKPRMDFRRREENMPTSIHIERTEITMSDAEEAADLPAFLLARHEDYLTLDQVIPPEAERVRVSTHAAHQLIERALRKNIRVRDVLRDMLGLESAMSDEVIFELPLTDEDYRTLAMRYKLRPDHRVEIRSRLEEDLREKLSIIAKD